MGQSTSSGAAPHPPRPIDEGASPPITAAFDTKQPRVIPLLVDLKNPLLVDLNNPPIFKKKRSERPRSTITSWTSYRAPKNKNQIETPTPDSLENSNDGWTRRTPDESERYSTLVIIPGEDVVKKVKMYVLNQRKSVTIVSANGSVSLAVVANIPSLPEFNYTYKPGQYEINLTGKLSPSENNNVDQNSSSLTGNIKVYLTLEGMKLDSGEAIKLIALSVIRVIVSPLVAEQQTDLSGERGGNN